MAQHDYVIANGTGSAVRSDLNNALAAIVSQNSGASEPSPTFAFQLWADTTTNTLKLRNSANSAWIELRQLDGDFTKVSVDNGTAGAPSIYFNASGTDTGFYSSGTDALDFSTAGTQRFGISSTGDLTVFGGNVTLNGQGDLRFADSDSSNWVAFQSPATVSSNVTWTLPSADGTNGQALTTNGSGTLSWTSPAATTDKITEGNTEAEVVDTGSDGHFKVTTEGTERFRCDSSGRLLVGTSSTYTDVVGGAGGYTGQLILASNNSLETGPFISNWTSNSSLDQMGTSIVLSRSKGNAIGTHGALTSGDAIATISFNPSDGSKFVSSAIIRAHVDGTSATSSVPARLVFYTSPGAAGATERMRISSAGLVTLQDDAAEAGIQLGTGADFTIKRNVASLGVQFNVGADLNNYQFQVGGSETMRINSAGELMIGYTSDNGAYKLQVNSQIFATSATIATSDGRYKENVASLGGCLDLVKALRPVSFTWKPQEDITRTDADGNVVLVRECHNFPEGTQVGFIAQEVQEALTDKPWLNSVIKENVRPAVLDNEGNELAPEEQFFGIAEGNLIAVLTNALQEAIAKIETLEAKVAALEAS